MKLTINHPPFYRTKETSRTIMGDMIIALIPLLVMAAYFYGLRSLITAAMAAAICWIADQIGTLLRRRRLNLGDFSPIVTGLIIAMLLPASVPVYVVASACIFAIFVVKQPFGGTGCNVFNPAAAGFAFAAVCWPNDVFRYPLPLERLEPWGAVTAKLVESPAFTLKVGGIPSIDSLELLLGNYAGPMGATNILVMTTCLLFLIIRKTVDWRIPVFYFASFSLTAWMLPRTPAEPMTALMLELFSGSVVFAGIYMMGDPVTSPKTGGGQILYAVLGGAGTMLFRKFGGYEQGAMFAILIANCLAYSLDKLWYNLLEQIRRLDFGIFKSKKA